MTTQWEFAFRDEDSPVERAMGRYRGSEGASVSVEPRVAKVAGLSDEPSKTIRS